MLWFTEVYSGENWELSGTGLTLKVKSAKRYPSAVQDVLVLETEDFGKVLVLDGAIQLTEKDEFIYHEMIVHPAMFTLREVERVLIIGGGDGGTAREVKKHSPQSVELVEVDETVIEVCRREFPQTSQGLEDVRILFDDGARYVKEKENCYDLIIVDCSDPVGPSKVLYTEDFYRSCKKALKEGGVLVTQSESPFAQRKVHKEVVGNLKKVFRKVRPYIAFIPTYPCGIWSFTIASDLYDPLSVRKEEVKKLYEALGGEENFRYYNPEIHYSAFSIPNFLKV